jgi:hypothetical protein
LLEVVKQFVDHKLNLADDDSIAMFERFLGHETWMYTAHDDRDAFGAKLVGDLVSAIDVARNC